MELCQYDFHGTKGKITIFVLLWNNLIENHILIELKTFKLNTY